MSILSARNLQLTREKNGAVFTLRVPRLELRAGSILAVVGKSGFTAARDANGNPVSILGDPVPVGTGRGGADGTGATHYDTAGRWPEIQAKPVRLS